MLNNLRYIYLLFIILGIANICQAGSPAFDFNQIQIKNANNLSILNNKISLIGKVHIFIPELNNEKNIHIYSDQLDIIENNQGDIDYIKIITLKSPSSRILLTGKKIIAQTFIITPEDQLIKALDSVTSKYNTEEISAIITSRTQTIDLKQSKLYAYKEVKTNLKQKAKQDNFKIYSEEQIIYFNNINNNKIILEATNNAVLNAQDNTITANTINIYNQYLEALTSVKFKTPEYEGITDELIYQIKPTEIIKLQTNSNVLQKQDNQTLESDYIEINIKTGNLLAGSVKQPEHEDYSVTGQFSL